MNTSALCREFDAALANITADDVQFLADCGVDRLLIAIYNLVGKLRITPARGNPHLWVPNEAGNIAYITPVRVDQAWSPFSVDPWSAVRFGSIVDLVAWDPRPKHRPHWRLRTGEATWLGATLSRELEPFPVEVRSTPHDWLRNAGTGLVVLSRVPADVARLVGALHDVIIRCVDDHEGRRIKELLWADSRERVPNVTILSPERRRVRSG